MKKESSGKHLSESCVLNNYNDILSVYALTYYHIRLSYLTRLTFGLNMHELFAYKSDHSPATAAHEDVIRSFYLLVVNMYE